MISLGRLLVTLVLIAPLAESIAGEVMIVDARAKPSSSGQFRFEVTLKHGDTGWDHYANQWQVVSIDGREVFGTRTLHHPHVHEQPFTRSLSGVSIPEDVTTVHIRARDSVHGVSTKVYPVELPR